ncbi:CMD domain protein [Microbacterium nymphoidis]|uniref:CMD domain protein n=1 Tax=Microbacterium nymphoidis TaxID=2898586 RepID=UPI001E590406|nr:CMD domain protein [Microbacterium nymphoidis]MCD2497840.1 CMD domain protein [Microbacterium nymphoidis]
MTAAEVSITDVVDELTGIEPDERSAALRNRRPVTREQLQASFDALFAPLSDEHFALVDRELVAAFATRLTADDAAAAFYADRARSADPVAADIVLAEAAQAATTGPFGHYREAGLQNENTDGVRYVPSEDAVIALGSRLAAALAHTHLLVYRPREADDSAIQALLDAGWDADGIITLSQLVSFLAFQQRVAAGLRALALARPASSDSTATEVSA